MFRHSKTILTAALACGTLAWQTAPAQADTYPLTPHLDLNATIGPAQIPSATRLQLSVPSGSGSGMTPPGQRSRSTAATPTPASNAPLFNDPPPAEGGWKGLAKVLDALTPSVDTSIPLTPSQITDRIEGMITQGQYDEALRVIAERKAQREAQNTLGADVQLLFLEARALAASGRHNDAITVYHDMTVQYPELPEPWNNLASEYVRQGKLEMAEQALHTALATNPRYATAQLNLGVVQLMLAQQAFDQAAQLGAPDAGTLANKTGKILQP